MKVTLQLQGDVFYPYDDESCEIIRKKSDNSVYVVDIVERRNPKFHRFAFKMFQILHDMIPGEMPFEEFRRLLTVKAGFYTAVGNVDGSVMVVPDSLKFDAMGEDEFKNCWNGMVQAFVTKYGNDITYEQLCIAAEI